MGEVSYFLAFGAGILSFISPCCLPLIPAYVSYITGASIKDLGEKKIPSKTIMLHSFLFVLGFSAIFILMGATSTILGRILVSHLTMMRKIAGIIIIVFGLHYAEFLRLDFLYTEKRFEFHRAGLVGSLLVGITFAAGWSPCIGPILGSILAYSATYETMREGMLLLSFYSAGFALPFLLVSWGISTFSSRFDIVKRHVGTIQIYTGYFMILVGVLMLTNLFSRLSGLLTWPGMV